MIWFAKPPAGSIPAGGFFVGNAVLSVPIRHRRIMNFFFGTMWASSPTNWKTIVALRRSGNQHKPQIYLLNKKCFYAKIVYTKYFAWHWRSWWSAQCPLANQTKIKVTIQTGGKTQEPRLRVRRGTPKDYWSSGWRKQRWILPYFIYVLCVWRKFLHLGFYFRWSDYLGGRQSETLFVYQQRRLRWSN